MPHDDSHDWSPELLAAASVVSAELRSRGYASVPLDTGHQKMWEWWFVRGDTPSGYVRQIVMSCEKVEEDSERIDLRVRVAVENDLVFVRREVAEVRTSVAYAADLLRQHWPAWVEAAETLTFAEAVTDALEE